MTALNPHIGKDSRNNNVNQNTTLKCWKIFTTGSIKKLKKFTETTGPTFVDIFLLDTVLVKNLIKYLKLCCKAMYINFYDVKVLSKS